MEKDNEEEEEISVVTISVPTAATLSSPSALLVQPNSSSPPLTLTLLQPSSENASGAFDLNKNHQRVNIISNKWCFPEDHDDQRETRRLSTSPESSRSNHRRHASGTLHTSLSEVNLADLSSASANPLYSQQATSALITASQNSNHLDALNSTAKSTSLTIVHNNSSSSSVKREDEVKEKEKASLWRRIKSALVCSRVFKSKDKQQPSSLINPTSHHKAASSSSRQPARLGRLLYYLRVTLTHLFSTTGLCFLVVAYSGLGAVIFTHLESGHEFAVKASLEDERRRTALTLWNYTEELNVLHREQWLEEVVKRIGRFEEKVVQTMLTEGYGATVEQWSFSGALLYSVTVITTIGYGNVTCKTDWGRIATILYAIVGIPITFLCLANLGNLMAKAFRFSYRKICCCECFCPSKTAKLRKRISQRSHSQAASRSASRHSSRHNRHKQKLAVTGDQKTEGSGGEPSPQAASAAAALPTAFILPPILPNSQENLPMPPAYTFDATLNGGSDATTTNNNNNQTIVLFSASTTAAAGAERLNASSAIDSLQRSHSLHTRSAGHQQQGPPSPALTMVSVRSLATSNNIRTELVRPKSRTEESHFITDVSGTSDIDDNENHDQEEASSSSLSDIDLDQEELDALEDEERVPISLVFLLVLGYIVLGAFMFSIWEQWGPIEGAYFCFTTLTTIGFGDLVPGSAKLSQDKDGQTKFIMCCVYMMAGLALIAMSFNLVQEEIVIKCRRIARRLGIMPSKREHKRFSARENRRRFRALWRSNRADQEKVDAI